MDSQDTTWQAEHIRNKSVDHLQEEVQEDLKTIRDLDRVLKERKKFSLSKASAIQFFLVASCAFITAFFANYQILNQFVSLATFFGFAAVLFIHYKKDQEIESLIKEKSFARVCYYQGSINDPKKTVVLSLQRMHEMRARASSQEQFLGQLHSTIDELCTFPPARPGALEVFYNTVFHYREYSFWERLKNMFSNEETDHVLGVDFWAKLYCQAALEKNIELMHRIHRDWVQGRIDAAATQSSSVFINAVLKQKQKLSERSENEEYRHRLDAVLAIKDLKAIPPREWTASEKINLGLISTTRFFGKDLVLNMADIKIYLTKQVLLSNQLNISMGAAAGGTFLGLSMMNLIPLTMAVFGIGGLAWLIRIGFRQYIRAQIKDTSIEDMIAQYHASSDDRWLSLIHLKIDMIFKSENREQILKKVFEFSNNGEKEFRSFERQNIFFMFSNYLETHQKSMSFEQVSDLINAVNSSTRPEIIELSENFLSATTKGTREQFQHFQDISHNMELRDSLQDMIFPLNTVANTVLSSIVLAIPLSAIIATCFITIFPAAAAILIGCCLGIYSEILRMQQRESMSKLRIEYMLTQVETPIFARIFQKKIDFLLQSRKKNPEAIDREIRDTVRAILAMQTPPETVKIKMRKYCDIALNSLYPAGIPKELYPHESPILMSREPKTQASDDFLRFAKKQAQN